MLYSSNNLTQCACRLGETAIFSSNMFKYVCTYTAQLVRKPMCNFFANMFKYICTHFRLGEETRLTMLLSRETAEFPAGGSGGETKPYKSPQNVTRKHLTIRHTRLCYFRRDDNVQCVRRVQIRVLLWRQFSSCSPLRQKFATVCHCVQLFATQCKWVIMFQVSTLMIVSYID